MTRPSLRALDLMAFVSCQCGPSNRLDPSMQRTPDTSHVLIATNHIPPSDLSILRAAILQQQLRLPYDLSRLHVTHADGLCVPINVVCFQDRVLVWSW